MSMIAAHRRRLRDARRRRADAEAQEIALRAAHRRRLDGVPVHDYAPDDLVRIHGVPEAGLGWGEPDQPRPVSWALVFIWIGVVALVILGVGLGWLVGRMDPQSVMDFLSPTAAQARDAGWVALSEGSGVRP
ncbi:hypothetical protein [Paracoccus thiocyanatus]|uniref:Uncharacterized protein n=1 Tax=Paracoccus thiocyanatus TaxID=34006 RepID=A0A3D8PEC3_9RHOB|nr:hypothetical protein [Paracoccus thiocyanatus]RDW14410.1 hypothetical protein DIE28_02585 [Paracoccus thiocyanatus]